MVVQGYTATLVAATLAISRSSLSYRKRPRGSRADRSYDEQIVMASGEKLAYGYRRVAWWLQRKKGLTVNRKRVLRVMRERGLLVRSRRLRARRKKEWGRVEAAEPNQIWQSDMTKIWAGPAVGWAYLVCVIDCCTREIVGWNLSHRCRTEDALAAVEQAVLERLPEGQPRGELDADHRQRDAVHFFALLGDAGAARHHTSADGVSSPGRQQLHRTVPSQLERGGSLDGGVSQLRRSADQHCSLDRGVQSRPASPPRSPKSHSARGILGFRRCTKK
jgi:transposase InsO family protein